MAGACFRNVRSVDLFLRFLLLHEPNQILIAARVADVYSSGFRALFIGSRTIIKDPRTKDTFNIKSQTSGT